MTSTFRFLSSTHLPSLRVVLEFVASADSDGDGNLSYKDFVDMLRDPDQKVEDMEQAPQEEGKELIAYVHKRIELSPMT